MLDQGSARAIGMPRADTISGSDARLTDGGAVAAQTPAMDVFSGDRAMCLGMTQLRDAWRSVLVQSLQAGVRTIHSCHQSDSNHNTLIQKELWVTSFIARGWRLRQKCGYPLL